MSALQRIFGHDTKFFDLLENGAAAAKHSATILVALLPKLAGNPSPEVLADLSTARRKHKRISQQTTEELCKNFVTPLEREDIEALSHSLYKIPKTAEKFGERLLLAPQHVRGMELKKQLAMLERAADTVVLMVKELRKGVNIEKVQAQNEQLQEIEGEADKLVLESLRDLYNGDHSALHVVVHKDLFELLEKVFDRCRDVGNIVFHIVLKHS